VVGEGDGARLGAALRVVDDLGVVHGALLEGAAVGDRACRDRGRGRDAVEPTRAGAEDLVAAAGALLELGVVAGPVERRVVRVAPGGATLERVVRLGARVAAGEEGRIDERRREEVRLARVELEVLEAANVLCAGASEVGLRAREEEGED